MTLPLAAEGILREGVLCYLAAATGRGPHCTPVVFVYEDGSLWATTRRGALKARVWRARPEAAALVRMGDAAVTLRGHVTLHDLIDPSTWGSSLLRAGSLARASARFTAKNARFFAGYARDAHRVPLAWTPPARIVVGVHPEGGAVLHSGGLQPWGGWDAPGDRGSEGDPGSREKGDERGAASHEGYRGTRRKTLELPAETMPEAEGTAVLAAEGRGGLATLPVRYRRRAGVFLCALPARTLALAGLERDARAALVIDRASSWRASAMRGAMLQGVAQSFVPDRVAQGRESLVRDARAGSGEAVVRLVPERATWWHGWTSGTVGCR